MKILLTLSALLASTLLVTAQEPGSGSAPKLLYVADGTSPARANAFANFLKGRFAEVVVTDHERFGAAAVRAADVVIFDWSQKKGDLPPSNSPLGERGDCNKPIVFLGTAGLHHSCAWEVAGGSG